MATKEELQVEATAEIEAAKPLNISDGGEIRELNDAEYEQKIIDLTNFKTFPSPNIDVCPPGLSSPYPKYIFLFVSKSFCRQHSW